MKLKGSARTRAWESKVISTRPWMKHLWGMRIRCGRDKYYKHVTYSISEEEIKCLWFREHAYEMKKPQIDRLDSELGYTFENCHFMEASEHTRKTNRERKEMCLRTGRHYGGGRPKSSDNREKEGTT
jgi:hypothetical protein